MPLTAVGLLKDTVSILHKNFWPLILIFALTDLSMFLLHRISHRITNEGGSLLGTLYAGCFIFRANKLQVSIRNADMAVSLHLKAHVNGVEVFL